MMFVFHSFFLLLTSCHHQVILRANPIFGFQFPPLVPVCVVLSNRIKCEKVIVPSYRCPHTYECTNIFYVLPRLRPV